ncbi:DNA-directed RNA polymerase subunit beta [candidate division WOR-3 bacterium JGI_Cruoil_03_44_89]|uniref:DNA-directed RNA polymerase subunit beta n=2 Tax=candidate division WOR-3 bacterium JGI_Cruoil_03_44_89 TaxID=1973748 RepID=A0A235BQF6_UNCW3|nr:MAG: DNA-directed RNA polymerase subunit beta [candidate division WOR-3 bacterium JGI_Cruoil_03_44_89]
MRKSFGKIKVVLSLPNLIEIQLSSFKKFLQKEIAPEKRENCGLEAIFRESFPTEDPHHRYSLEYVKYTVKEPKLGDLEAIKRGSTYSSPLYVTFRLISRDEEGNTKNLVEQCVYLCNFPIMTDRGTFVINGVEKVVVNQLRRAPGVYFSETVHPTGKRVFKGEIIPYHGSWIEFTTDANDVLLVNLDKRHRFPVSTLFKALGFVKNEDILTALYEMEEVPLAESSGRFLGKDCADPNSGITLAFAGTQLTQDLIDSLASFGLERVTCTRTNDLSIILSTLKKDDKTRSRKDALYRIYYLLRGTSPSSTEMAEAYLKINYFSRNYHLSDTGRYKMNKKLNANREETTLQVEDIIDIVKYMLNLSKGEGGVDDIDHLGNRHLKRVGELLSDQVRIAIGRVNWQARERMLLHSRETLTPMDLINTRLFSNVLMSFFLVSQLCQFMDQTNLLAEISHMRRLSRLGPGGLTRKTAGLEVRDVHYSHYGRICPIETPEGPNIGIISYLSTYAKVDKYGFIVTPYRKVVNCRVTDRIEYLTADEEDPYVIAQANAPLHKDGRFVEKVALSRKEDNYPIVPVDKVDYMDISPKQLVSVSAALIPFLEHDDANRALMGSNMQRQAVPLLFLEPPIVGTGLEEKVARDSASAIIARTDGVVKYLDADLIVIEPDGDTIEPEMYDLTKFRRTNQDTCIDQMPMVNIGARIKKGDVIVDGAATKEGELALGKNILVAFMPWLGYNFEDAIVISEKLLEEDTFTSLHIQQFEVQIRDTKLGPEEITREIPNVSEQAVKDLDANGIIRIGARVEPDDILVGKVSPKGEVELTPEERLIRAIFGEKARDVKDTSLRVSPGVTGIVTDVVVLSRRSSDKITKEEIKDRIREVHLRAQRKITELRKIVNGKKRNLLKGRTALADLKDKKGNIKIKKGKKIPLLDDKVLDNIRIIKKSISKDGYEKIQKLNDKQNEAIKRIKMQEKVEVKNASEGDNLPPGVLKVIKVYIGQVRSVMVGDKLSGRHGNKGTIAKIAFEEDVPYLSDGTPVDMILNPLGVPSRMNVGQTLETQLGWAAKLLNTSVACPVFEGAKIEEIEEMLKEAHLPSDGKATLYDGRTGKPFHDKITVGYIYMMKLSHMVEDKVHARSIGSYSLVTQQPLGGKAQFGGQRFGEMEVWALESYGAAYTLQEMLTVKSDDIMGRKKLYEALVKGESLPEPRLPISFNVLLKELAGLCMEIELVREK